MKPDLSTRFTLGDILGVGTVGTIYSALDSDTRQQVAVKKLNPRVSHDPLIRARFKREMAILQRLQHPNIVAYVAGGTDDDSLYYAMERVRGGTIKSVLESGGPLPWLVVVDLGIQICSALQCAHNHGVIHRDLKPSNLFLTVEAQIKLGDFGIARDLNRADLTEDGFTVGTHAYMAPEQIRGEQSVSAKADLYALGCCLYEMLTNRKPFTAENYTKLFDQHLKAPPPLARKLAPQTPEDLEQLITDLLEKDPDDRPFNARYVQAELLKLRQQASDSATTTSEIAEPPSEILRRRIRTRHQSPVVAPIGTGKLLAIFALLIVTGALAYVFRQVIQ